MDTINKFLSASYFGNTLLQYLTAVGILVLGIIVSFVITHVIVKKLRSFVERTSSSIDDFIISIIEKSLNPLLIYGVLYLSLRSLNLNPGFEKLLSVCGVILLTVMAVRFILATVQFALFRFWIPKHENRDMLELKLRGLMPAISILIWAMAIVFILDNLGFKISTIIAGLGIGGVALALASQTVLADLFSYFAILFDQPFVIGDFIIVGDKMGSVEKIGIKTTRVRSLSGEQLVFGNKDLTSATIQNYKRMKTRRIVFNLAVVYDTPMEKLREIPQVIKNIITKIPLTTFDRAHFNTWNSNGLNFEVVYIVMTDDYNKYMDIQQEINLSLKQELENRHISFSYATQTLYVNMKNPSEKPRDMVHS